MDFSFTEEQNQIRGLAKQVLGDLVTDDALKALTKNGQWFHQQAWKRLAESDLLGLALPEGVGGAGMGLIELCLLLEQAGRRVAPVPVLATLVSAALPIARFGTAEQHQRWLSGVATGEKILTAAFSEASNRNPYLPAARAQRQGQGWTVDGVFTNVQYADRAQHVLLAARINDKQIIIAIVDLKQPGISLAAQLGTNGELLHQVTLKAAQIDDAQILGTPETGAEILKYAVDVTTLGICALQLGTAEEALRLTATFSAERKQFGVPIATFQGVSQRAGDMYIDAQAMRVSLWQACWRLSEALNADQALAIAKFWAAEGGARVVAAAQHIHGGMGFDRDYPLHRYFLSSKHNEFTLGGAGEQLKRLGDLIVSAER